MKTTAQYVDTLRQQTHCLQTEYNVSSLSIFGSVARQQHGENSDVDVCVEMPVNHFRRLELKAYLESILGCHVDVVRRHNNMNRLLTKQIETDGIRIF